MYKKIPHQDIASILGRYQLSDEARQVLKPELSPAEAVEVLQQAKLASDVVQFLAHALPMMEAIFWASESMNLRLDAWTEQEKHTINAARNWLQKPDETHRVRANQLAERVGLESAPAWVAKAVFFSGTGSIVEPDLPVVMPPPFLYGHSVAAAITIAAAVPEWQGYAEFYTQVIQRGLAIAEGLPLQISLIELENN